MKTILLLTLLTIGAVTASDFYAGDDLGDFDKGLESEDSMPTISTPSTEPTSTPVSSTSEGTSTTAESTSTPVSSTSEGTSTTAEPTSTPILSASEAASSTVEPSSTPVTPTDEGVAATWEPVTVLPEAPGVSYPDEYRHRRSYIYRYEAQVLTGIPELSNQHSGYRLRCKVRLSMLPRNVVHMRLEDVKFLQTNRILPLERPIVLLPLTQFRALSHRQDLNNIRRMLRLPVSFTWLQNGWVKDIRVSKRDTFWSINLKKGLMTMLNVNLRINPNTVLRGNGIFKKTPYFEDGVDGHCQASYNYRRSPYASRNRRQRLISITKTRDLNACKKKPWFEHMLFEPEKCSVSRNPIAAQAETRYLVSVVGSRRIFLRDIRTAAKYSFSERDMKRDGSVDTFTVQRLRFIKTLRQADELLKPSDSVQHRRGLMMVIPVPEMKRWKKNNDRLVIAARVQAIKIVRHYMADNLDMYGRMRILIGMVRRMSSHDIDRLLTTTLQEPEMKSPVNKRIFCNIISKAATKQVVDVILKRIESRTKPDEMTAMMVSRLSGMSFVSHDVMIKKMMAVALRIRSPKQKETLKALMFTIGKLLNTHFKKPIPGRSRPFPRTLTRAAIKEFYTTVLSQRSMVLSRELKTITVIHSLGNCGLVNPCLSLLEPFVPPRRPNRLVNRRPIRVAALSALRSFADEAPRRIRSTTIPVFHDLREDVELRLTALESFIAAQPGKAELKLLTELMKTEPVRQVRTFIATLMSLISEARDLRCQTPLALNSSRLLRELAPELVSAQGMQFSRILGLRLPLQDTVAALITNLKLSPKGFLPRQLSASLLTKALGLNIDLGNLGIRADDAQQLLDALLGPQGTARTAKTVEELLKETTGRSKIDTDFTSSLRLYNSMYRLDGLTQEITRTLRKGRIPVSRDIFRLATQGGQLKRDWESISYWDQLSKIATTLGIPLNVNHTIGAHLSIQVKVEAQPKLLASRATVGLNIRGRASARHTLRAGVDMTIIKSLVSAMHQVHVPRTKATVKIAWVNRRPRIDQLNWRLNLARPQSDTKVFHMSGRLYTAQWSQAKPRALDILHLKDRTLPLPPKKTSVVAKSQPLGLALVVERRVLNFTGVAQPLATPYFAPRDIKIIIRSLRSIPRDLGIDITGKISRAWSSLEDVVGNMAPMNSEFQGKETIPTWYEEKPLPSESPARDDEEPIPEEEEMEDKDANEPFLTDKDEEQRTQFFSKHRRLRLMILQLALRLDRLPLNGRPIMKPWALRSISRGQVVLAPLRNQQGLAFHLYGQRHLPTRRVVIIPGVLHFNKAIKRAHFMDRHPLRLIKDIQARLITHMIVDRRPVSVLSIKGTMGDLWSKNIERIIRNGKKELPAIPDIQRCQSEMRRRLIGTPACYQAWKSINSITRCQASLRISDKAPQWLKQLPLTVLNLVRRTQADALIRSRLIDPVTKQIRLDDEWQLSPYNQHIVSGYLRVLNIIDRYINARLLLSRRNSIVQRPQIGLVSNIFDDLYPAKCEVVRRGPRLMWRTFDRVDRNALSPLAAKSGRVVLVQDIQRRLLITEQKSANHRIIQMRLKNLRHHVLIVVNERLRLKVPNVFYRGQLRRLPFRLYNAKRQIVLEVYRERTPRTTLSLTAVMPEVGCVVRTNPVVGTEIRVTPFLHSNVRGICGDFNGEKWDDGKGPMCHTVFSWSSSLLKRYTTLLVRPATLQQIETNPAMVNFMRATQCPDRRYYPRRR